MNTTVRFVDRNTTVRFPAFTKMTQAQFNAFMATYNASLQPFTSNEAAHTALGAGKEYVAGFGNTETAQGVKMITYAP